MYIYWTKKGKFEVDNSHLVPCGLHSPNDSIPALIYPNGTKVWYNNGKRHRLNGPAIIDNLTFFRWFLFGTEYVSLEHWLENHPNQNLGFQTKMKLQYT